MSQQKRAEDDRRQCKHFHEGSDFAHGCADSRSKHVRPRKADDRCDGDQLHRRTACRHAEQVEQKFPEDYGECGNCGWGCDEDVQPAEYERSGVAICFAQEHVDTTGARQQRAQLRHRERATNADQAERGPQAQDDERIRDERRDRRRFPKDPAADCDADDKRRSAEEPDDAPEIVRR